MVTDFDREKTKNDRELIKVGKSNANNVPGSTTKTFTKKVLVICIKKCARYLVTTCVHLFVRRTESVCIVLLGARAVNE